MKSFKRFFFSHKRTLYALFAAFLFSTTVVVATPPATPYTANETLDPNCGPSDTNCFVVANTLTSGLSGGQTVVGGTESEDDLVLSSTGDATKGKIIFGNSAYDEQSNRLGVGTTTPNQQFVVARPGAIDVVASPNVTAHQGYTTDGTYHYIIHTDRIDKRADDASWTLLTSNPTALAGVTGVNHLGDGDYYNGKLYIVVETYIGCPASNSSGQKVLVYNADTLVLENQYDISALDHEVSSIVIVPDEGANGVAYITDFCDGGQIYMYDLLDFSYLGEVELDTTIPSIQGITSDDNGTFYLSTEDAKLYSLNYDGGDITLLYTMPTGGSHEGITYYNGVIRWLNDLNSNGLNSYIHYITPATSVPSFAVTSVGTVSVGTSAPSSAALMHIGSGGTGKVIIDSLDSSFGQMQIGNRSGDESSIGFISNAASFGSTGISNSGNSNIWAMGAGIYNIGGDKFGIGNKSMSASLMTLTSTGFVGIGTTTPNTFMSESGGLAVYNALSSQVSIIGNRTTDMNVGQLSFYNNAIASGEKRLANIAVQRSGADNSGIMVFRTTNAGTIADRMVITKEGNVGIGTSSNPTVRLHVLTSTTTDQAMLLRNSNATGVTGYVAQDDLGTRFLTFGISNSSMSLGSSYGIAGEGLIRSSAAATGFAISTVGGPIRFLTTSGGTERMRIDNGGNVGIGTSSIQNNFHVRSGVSNAFLDTVPGALIEGLEGHLQIASDDSGNHAAALMLTSLTSSWVMESRPTAQSNRFSIGRYTAVANADIIGAYTEYMSISSIGHVGISNTAPGYLFHVGSASVTSGTTVTRFQNAGGTCDVVPNTAGGITCTSDETLKKNITTLDGQSWLLRNNLTTQNNTILDSILTLTPVKYNMKVEDDSTEKHVGFIAQELEQLFPDLVRTDEQGLKSVNYAGMMPYTVKALQEMNMNVIDISDLTKENSWRDSLVAWLGNASNGISKIFAKEVVTEKLCVEDVCVTRDQFMNMLQNSGTQYSSPSTPQPDPTPETPVEPTEPVVPVEPAPALVEPPVVAPETPSEPSV